MGFENLTAVEQIGATVAEKLLDTGLQYYSQKNFNEQAQADTQKNMRLASDLALRNQYQSIVNAPMAMRAAGLNPALMNQGVSTIAGVGSPIAGPNGQMGRSNSSTYSENLLAAKQIALMEAEKENVEASTDKMKAETTETRERTPTHRQNIEESKSRIGLNEHQAEMLSSLAQKYGAEVVFIGEEYQRKLDEDSVARRELERMYNLYAQRAESAGDYDLASYWRDLAKKTSDMTIGAFYALRDYSAYINDLDEYEKQAVLRELQKKIANMQLNSDSVLYDIAHMPSAEFYKIMAQIGELGASRDMKQAYADVGIPSQSEYYNQMEQTTRHNDFVGNIKDGNYSDAAWSQVPGILHFLEEAGFIYLFSRKGGATPVTPEKGQTVLPSFEESMKAHRNKKDAQVMAERKAKLDAAAAKRRQTRERKNFNSAIDEMRKKVK